MGVGEIKLYDICPEAVRQGLENCEITGITDNTANVTKGSLFVCIKGTHFDGHSVAAKMIEKGAAAVAAERDTGCKNQIICDNTRLELSRLSSAFYSHPTKYIQMFAVTGTNGKTTTAHLVKHILSELGKKCGCIGTAGNDTCGTFHASPHGTPTTPNAPVLYSWFAEMRDNKADCCVMEASSQALAQYRIADENFAAAGFTNLTRDHLDYHKTMENYFKAKRRLFTMAEKAVICIDDEYGRRLAEEFSDKAITYSVYGNADLYASFIKMTARSSEFMLVSERDRQSVKVRLNFTGLYNIQNALCAIGMTAAAGYDICECAKALESCKGVNGRLNVIYSGDFTVITDYAHTDDALEKMLSTLKNVAEKRIICVFGAAGDRDCEKRPMMGKAASQYADVLVITSDNPAHEDPDAIIEAVYSGTDKSKEIYRIADRRQAIEKALMLAQCGDIVVLAGKGHESYQIINDDYIPFCEADIVKEIIDGKGK